MQSKDDTICSDPTSKFYTLYRLHLKQHKVELLTDLDQFSYLKSGINAPYNIQNNRFIDNDVYYAKMKSLYFSLYSAQFEFGYFLIYYDSLPLSKANEHNVISSAFALHHLYLTYECLYRVWERVTHIMYYLHTYKKNKRLYYDGMIRLLEKNSMLYDENIMNIFKN